MRGNHDGVCVGKERTRLRSAVQVFSFRLYLDWLAYRFVRTGVTTNRVRDIICTKSTSICTANGEQVPRKPVAKTMRCVYIEGHVFV